MRRGELLAWAAAALLLRALRAPARWDEITLAYAAYGEPVARALGEGRLAQALATWVGLHPPLHAALLAGIDALWPAPGAWILLSVLASLGAALALGRAGGPVALAVLATAPLQLAYCGEVNNYPLAVLALALVLAAAEGPWSALAAAAILAGWSHVLAGLGGLGVVCRRLARPDLPRSERISLALAVGLGLLPVGAGALRRLGWESTWGQPPLEGGLLSWIGEAVARVGPEGLLIGGAALLGLRGAALAAALPLGIALGSALILGAASPAQFPYLLLLGPPLALGAARIAKRPWVKVAILLLCGLRGLRAGADELAQLSALVADMRAPRAIDAALSRARPGDRLWLVSPALLPDDDKSDTGPVLWRLSPWRAWARAALPGFEYTDPAAGQPRRWRGMVVHCSTTLEPAALDVAAAETLGSGGRLYVVLYDHLPATGLAEDVAWALTPYVVRVERSRPDPDLGSDLLFTVEGRR